MLQKQGERGLTKGFKKRYMVQKQAKIFYYKNKNDTKHIGSINLVEALRIEVAKEGKTHFKVRPLLLPLVGMACSRPPLQCCLRGPSVDSTVSSSLT